MITITIPGTPVGKGRPRFARRGAFVTTYSPEKTQNYEALVKMAASNAMDGRSPMNGAVEIHLSLYITPPESWSKKKKAMALAGEVHPTTKPDIDNTLKGILDACNGIVWLDDKQVVNATVTKQYGDMAMAVLIVHTFPMTLSDRLRRLADEMTEVGVDIDYYGGFSELARHGKELCLAASAVRDWAINGAANLNRKEEG